MIADIFIALVLFFIVLPFVCALIGQVLAGIIKAVGEFFQFIGDCVNDVVKVCRLLCRFLKFCKSKCKGKK